MSESKLRFNSDGTLATNMGLKRVVLYSTGLLVVLLLLIRFSVPPAVTSEYLGQQIEFQGRLISGQSFDLQSHRGKVVVINFWATSCPYCLEEMPLLKKIYAELKYDDFVVIGVSSDQPPQLQSFLSVQPQPWENIYGSDSVRLGSQYEVDTIPRTFLINRNGVLVSVGTGVETIQNEIYDLVRRG